VSELLRELRKRVDEIVAPHVEVYGQDAPVVKMALRVLAEAEDIERSLGTLKVTTDRAHELTGWARETLCKYARMKVEGRPVPAAWEGLIVDESPSGYSFVLGSIPDNPRAQAA
jgi:hypothetical protein